MKTVEERVKKTMDGFMSVHYLDLSDEMVSEAIRQGFCELVEDCASECERTVTFSPEHIDYAPEDPAVKCGWCDGLEKAAANIRALATPPLEARIAAACENLDERAEAALREMEGDATA